MTKVKWTKRKMELEPKSKQRQIAFLEKSASRKELETLISEAYDEGVKDQALYWKGEVRKGIEGFVSYAVVEAMKHQGNMFDGFMFDKAKEYIKENNL